MRARGPARAGRARRAGPVPGGAPVAVVPLHVSSAAAPGGRGRGRRGRVCGAAGGQGEGEGGPVPSAPVPVRLVGTGSAVPERVVTNRDLEALVETDDAWIRSRTGIGERRVLGAGETVTGLAARACERALAMAGVGAEAVDLILLATSTADDAFGGAGLLQRELGATNAVAFDVTAACSGFVVAAVTGAQYVGSGAYRTVLVVGADAMSRLTDWRDRNTCILFGDASGAVVLRAGAPDSGPSGLLGFSMHSNGGGYDNLRAPVEVEGEGEAKPFAAGPAARAGAGYAPVAMAGQEVFKFATRAVPQVLREAADRSGVALEDVDWFVLHQANQRILDSAAKKMGVDGGKVLSNIARYGNTSAASIPLALDEAVRAGQVQAGDVVATSGFGAGLTWAAAIFRWGDQDAGAGPEGGA